MFRKNVRYCSEAGSAWLMYSPLIGRKTFRMTIVLKESINEKKLKEAVKDMKTRVPKFFVRLERNCIRDYFVYAEDIDVVEQAPGIPPREIQLFNTKKPLFRVIHSGKSISLEADHELTDGYGAMLFLRSLLARYFQLIGININYCDYIHFIEDAPKDEEFADCFTECRINEKIPLNILKDDENTFNTKLGDYQDFCRLVNISMNTKDVIHQSKIHGTSVTEYFAAVILYAFYLNSDKPVTDRMCINIPISLRGLVGSKTMRNFSDTITIGLIPSMGRGASFSEFVSSLKGSITLRTDKKALMQRINKSIMEIQNPLFNKLPRFIKLYFFKKKYYCYHGSSVSSFSNIGLIDYPKEMAEHIELQYVAPIKIRQNQVAFCCMSTYNKCVITASQGNFKMEVVDKIIETLKLNGLDVDVWCVEE